MMTVCHMTKEHLGSKEGQVGMERQRRREGSVAVDKLCPVLPLDKIGGCGCTNTTAVQERGQEERDLVGAD